MRLVVGLAVAVMVAAGCATAPDAVSPTEPATRAEGEATPAASEEATPAAAPAPPQSEDPDYRAVVQAREAAWHAWIDTVAPPRVDPEHPALQETHATALVLHMTRWAMDTHTSRRTLRHLPDSSIEVQSVTFPDDTTAWLETCLVLHVEDRTEAGKLLPGDFSETGTTTRQQTEVMRKEDGAWKLAEAIVNSVGDGRKQCVIGDPPPAGASSDVYSEAVITRAREASEEALADLLAKDCCSLKPKDLKSFSATHTGQLLNEYSYRFTSDRHLDQPPEKRAVRYFSSASDCVSYPGTGLPPKPPDRKYAKKTYALFDEYWKQFGDADPQYGNSSPGCIRVFNTSTPFGRFASGAQSSSVVVYSVTLQASASPTVAYIKTCRQQKLKATSGTPGMRVDHAIIRATESMGLEDGTWKLADRWDITIDEYSRNGCDQPDA